MADEPDYLGEFFATVQPCDFFWRSLDLACVAVRFESEWVQLTGKAILCTKPIEANSTLKRVVDLKNLRAYTARLECTALDGLIMDLRNSMVIAEMPESPVRLVPSNSRPYSWHQPRVTPSLGGNHRGKSWPSMIRTFGTGNLSASLLPQDFWNIDTQLRDHKPPYNGFRELCASLGLQYEPYNSTPQFDLCAELPAKFLDAEVNRRDRKLIFTMEYVATPNLVIEWLPGRQTSHEHVPAGEAQIPAQHEIAIEIPPNSTAVAANLMILGMDADGLSYRVDWENTLLRICEFFDPSQSKLADFLFKENDLKNANPFELGVARLLALAGYVVLWFGKGAKDALPDLVAYSREARGKERILYGECTLKNPAEKLSDFAKRSEAFKKHLGLEAGDVLPVVFVRNETTELDRGGATELGSVLCDGTDIQQLQDRIRSDATPDDVFQFLKSLGRIPGMF